MEPSGNPNNDPDYCRLKLGYACEVLIADLAETLNPVIEWLRNSINSVATWLKKELEIFFAKPINKKLVRLALYAKKSRVRKKNIHRLQKIIK